MQVVLQPGTWTLQSAKYAFVWHEGFSSKSDRRRHDRPRLEMYFE